MMASEKSDKRNQDQPDRQFGFADHDIQRRLPQTVLRKFVAQHQNRQRLHRETPDHAERVRFAQQSHVSAGDQNRDQLQQHDRIDQSRGGAEAVVRMAEPVGQHAILGDAIEHAVGADDRGIDGPGQQQHAHQHDHTVEGEPQAERTDQVHRKAADQVVQKLRTGRIRNDHHREERNQRREDHAVREDHPAGALQILQLGMGDFTVDLRQASRSRSWRAANDPGRS